jgi:hypothetical protein
MVEGMEITQQVAKASARLFARFCTADERKQPPPPAAVLIGRVITAAASPKPAADAADLRAALALVAADQWATESRELNLIRLARDRGLPWRDIAWSLGLDSPQAAEKRFQRLARPPETLIYAFRVAESDEPWYGKPDALPTGSYETGLIHFNPARPGPFQDHTLELRYGPVDEEVMPGPMRAYAQVNNRRIAVTALVQNTLFTSEIREALDAAKQGGIREALNAAQGGLGEAIRAARGY